MSDERKKGRLQTTLVALLLMLVVYPLSVGPARWILDRVDPSGDWPIAHTFYRPLALICEHLGVSEQIGAYEEWWGRE